MTNPEISKLAKEMREAAEKATPGPWFTKHDFLLHDYGNQDCEHMAIASPANILKLLDYFERVEGQQ